MSLEALPLNTFHLILLCIWSFGKNNFATVTGLQEVTYIAKYNYFVDSLGAFFRFLFCFFSININFIDFCDIPNKVDCKFIGCIRSFRFFFFFFFFQ